MTALKIRTKRQSRIAILSLGHGLVRAQYGKCTGSARHVLNFISLVEAELTADEERKRLHRDRREREGNPALGLPSQLGSSRGEYGTTPLYIPPNEDAMEPTEEITTPAPGIISVWVCPRCAGWYGSSMAGNLSTSLNRRSSLRNLATEDPKNWSMVTGPRSECQRCKVEDGVTVQRELTAYAQLDTVAQAIREIATSKEEPLRGQTPYDPTATNEDPSNVPD